MEHIKLGYQLILALRPHQWLKNLLIFLPMLMAHTLNSEAFLTALLAFIIFCLIASSCYLINDIIDLESDRAHPRKRLRQLASGKILVAHAIAVAAMLIIISMYLSTLIGLLFFITICIYFFMSLIYSIYIKEKIVIDIIFLAGFYTLRIFAGGVASDTMPSMWLLAFSIFFFHSLAAVKRQAELVDIIKRNKNEIMGRGYQANDLTILNIIALSSGYLSVLVLALYINSPDINALYSNPAALWAICYLLLYWLTRMVFITSRGGMSDDPIIFAIRDRVSLLCFLIAIIFIFYGAFL